MKLMNTKQACLILAALFILSACTTSSSPEEDQRIEKEQKSIDKNAGDALLTTGLGRILQKDGYSFRNVEVNRSVNPHLIVDLGYVAIILNGTKQGFPSVIGWQSMDCSVGCSSGSPEMSACAIQGCNSGFAAETKEGLRNIIIPHVLEYYLPESCQFYGESLVNDTRASFSLLQNGTWRVTFNNWQSSQQSSTSSSKMFSICTMNGELTDHYVGDFSKLRIDARMILDCTRDTVDYADTSQCYAEKAKVKNLANATKTK